MDAIHPFGDHIHWSERLQFNFYDRASGLCGIMSIRLRPNAALKDVACQLMMPDGSVVGLEGSVPLDRPTFDAKGLTFDMTEPEKRWTVRFVGGMERTTERKAKKSHVELELEFEALSRPFDHRWCASGQTQQMSGDEAFECSDQVGSLIGRLSTGLDEFEVDALGERHNSWGVRDWTALKGWTRFACQFSKSHALSLTRTVTDEGISDAGFVFLEGRNIPVKRVELDVNMDFDRNPKSFGMTLHDDDGNSHKVFGSVTKKVAVHFKTPDNESMVTMNENLARYTVAGKNGYGIAEFLNKTD